MLEMEQSEDPQEYKKRLLQAITKESFQDTNLAHLSGDFFTEIAQFIQNHPEIDTTELKTLTTELIRRRLGKFLPMVVLPLDDSLNEKLSNEEKELFNIIYKSINNFKQDSIGGKHV